MDIKKLNRNNIIILILGIAVIFISYFYMDRSIVEWTNIHTRDNYTKILKYMSELVVFYKVLIPVVFIGIFIYFLFDHKSPRWHVAIIFMGVNLLFTHLLNSELKFLFGRYWPATWINNNPSWISDKAYGFHPLHWGSAYESFPSGHTSAIFAIMTILWFTYPRWRTFAVINCLIVMTGLLLLADHYFSDIIGGALVGYFTGSYMSYLFLNLEKTYVPK